MPEDARIYIVRELIAEHTKSPSLRHIRDPYALNKLAHQIVRRLDGSNTAWKKWNGPREALLKAAIHCWIPTDDMRDYLNGMEGQALTTTDVAQRLRELHEEHHTRYPNEELQSGCLALYEKEKAAGTELPAIIGAIQEHVELEEQRLYSERETSWRAKAEEERNILEQRFLSGADSKWTPVKKSKELYCRINGRTYRLTPTNDKMWNLDRIRNFG